MYEDDDDLAFADEMMEMTEIVEMLETAEVLEEEIEPIEVNREMLEDGTRIVYMSNGGRIVTHGGGKYIYDGDGILVEHQTPTMMGMSVTSRYDPNEVGFGPDDDIDNEDAVATASTTKMRMKQTEVDPITGAKQTIRLTTVSEGDVRRQGVQKTIDQIYKKQVSVSNQQQKGGISVRSNVRTGEAEVVFTTGMGRRIVINSKEVEQAGIDIRAPDAVEQLFQYTMGKVRNMYKPMGS